MPLGEALVALSEGSLGGMTGRPANVEAALFADIVFGGNEVEMLVGDEMVWLFL